MKIRRQTLAAAALLAAFFVPDSGLSAADLLRRAPAAAPAAGAPAAGGSSDTAEEGLRSQTLVNNTAALIRTKSILHDLRRLQSEARAAAQTGADRLRPDLPDVPDGLVSGGLVVARDASGNPVRWQGAALPAESADVNGRIQVSVTQTTSQALLNWETFNIGKKTDLHFDQSAGGADRAKWTVFNQVNDPSAAPSQILGSIFADGQVYVINRNGIIFGGSSQVNTRGFTASALPLNENLVERGLLNNPDSQFLFSGLALPAGANGTPGFSPEAPHPALGRYGDVIVQAGAILQSAVDQGGAGGRIALFGANVDNQGTLSTPNGQTILAAGLQIGVAAHNAEDASLRGLDVYVGAVAGSGTPAPEIYAGTVTHGGVIETPRGNTTIAGKTLRVDGAIESSTSVALNGRVDLNASYGAVANPETALSSGSGHAPFLHRETGQVLLGENSLLRILPELDSKETVAAGELALRSQINISGLAIHLGDGAVILAPNARVSLNAGVWNYLSSPLPTSNFVNAQGQIYLDKDALISVAGSAAVPVSVASNIIAVELRGAELADSPLQRNGFLRGQTIYVDIRATGVLDGKTWIGTPIADVSGHVNLIERGIGELTVDGGEVSLNAGGAVVIQNGATIDVSAGWIDYQDAAVRTTSLLLNGQIIDIADARPDIAYDAIHSGNSVHYSEKWNVTRTFDLPLVPSRARLEKGFVHSGAGGAIAISAAAMALDGKFVAHVTAGEKQREVAPAASSLTLKFETRDLAYPAAPPLISPTPPTITFTEGDSLAPADAFALDDTGRPIDLRADRVAEVRLSSGLLTESGLGSLEILNHDGDIFIPENVTLTGGTGGSIKLGAANIDIRGAIVLAGGTVSLTAYNLSYAAINQATLGTNRVNPPAEAGRGKLTIGAGARISTAGRRADGTTDGTPAPALNAGSISLSGYDTVIASGATLDVSGGVFLSAEGKIRYGNAGSIALGGGRDEGINSVLGGSLVLDGTLLGHAGAGANAGSLVIVAPRIQIGGEVPAAGFHVAPEFFSEGGFSSFSFSGIGAPTDTADVYQPGLRIAAGAEIRPVVESLFAYQGEKGLVVERRALEEGERPAARLSFSAVDVKDPFANQTLVRSELVVEAGSLIETDARGQVSFAANVIDFNGGVVAAGGSIEIRGGSSYDSLNPDTTHGQITTRLGEQTLLDVSGRTLLEYNPHGLRTGTVLAGGSITVSGNLVAETGAILDASGSTDVLDYAAERVPHASGTGTLFGDTYYLPVRIDSSGGTIRLQGGQLLASNATLRAGAGGADAGGGTLSVSSGRFDNADAVTTTADINLRVTQSGTAFSSALSPIGGALRTAGDTVQDPGGHFSLDAFHDGGFDHLQLGGNVLFSGAVDITARGSLRISTAGVIQSTDQVRLTAPHVHLGQNFVTPVEPGKESFLFTKNTPGVGVSEHRFAPTHGTGRLEVEARQLDLGTLSLQQFGSAAFNVSGGNVQGSGFVNIAGEMEISAGQVHPVTGGALTLSAFDYQAGGTATGGSIVVRQAGGTPALPASATGTLNIFAARIEQHGTLRAPFGIINLGNDAGTSRINGITGTAAPTAQSVLLGEGSLTSVSAINNDGTAASLPYGVLLNGVSWIDPRGVDITLDGLPAKAINLAAADIITTPGSTVDTRGGGDLFAYRFVAGAGGSTDILASPGSFAIIPGAQPLTAPGVPFNPSPENGSLDGTSGYQNTSLAAGSQIYLSGVAGLPEGTYTLLPARYALLPGAFLITPGEKNTAGAVRQDDGSFLATGYRVSGLNGATAGGRVYSTFEIAPREIVLKRAEYQITSANKFLRDAATEAGNAIPRLPVDAGRLAFSATRTLELEGAVRAGTPEGGRGSQIDISSARDILITTAGANAPEGVLTLDVAIVNQFGASSLLIGGHRSATAAGDTVTSTTGTLTVDNAGAPLVGSDIILVAQETLHLADGAAIRSTGSGSAAEPLLLGDAAKAGSGDGALLRVSAAGTAPVLRLGTSDAALPNLLIGDAVSLAGGTLVLDSSGRSTLSDTAILSAEALALHSGRISLVLDESGDSADAEGLILSGDLLDSVLSSASNLSLLSYASIDLYGTGVVGSADFQHISLSTPALRQLGGGVVEFQADELRLGNATGVAAGSAPGNIPLTGALVFTGERIEFTDGTLAIQGFSEANLAASAHFLFSGNGTLRTQGNLTGRTPLFTSATGASLHLDAAGTLALAAHPDATASGDTLAGLGGKLQLSASALTLDTRILLPAGQITALARTGDLAIGENSAARLEVSGTAKAFHDITRVTNAGTISLAAGQGSVRLAAKSTLDVSATAAGGESGSLTVATPAGQFIANGTLLARGSGGTFVLDTAALASTAALDGKLNSSGFSAAREYRVRTGDVLVDGTALASLYKLAVDGGSLTVTGKIDASGETGGTIALGAAGNLTVGQGARLDTSARAFSASGKGGKISLEAGSQIDGTVSPDARLALQSGATIDLSVARRGADDALFGRSTGTLSLRAPLSADGQDPRIDTIASTIKGASHISVEGYILYDLTGTDGVITTAWQNRIRNDAEAFLGTAGNASGHYAAMRARLLAAQPGMDALLVIRTGAEIINRTGDLVLGSANATAAADWNLSGHRFGPDSAPGVLTLRAAGDLVFHNALSDSFAGGSSLWLSPLLAQNAALPANLQSWDFRLTAGADTGAADFRAVLPGDLLAAGKGSLLLGKNTGSASVSGGNNALTSALITNNFQVIRTGTGDITITAGRDILLLNPFAAIYTAGTAVPDAASIFSPGDFSLPVLASTGGVISQGNLGSTPQAYQASYAHSGGDVSLHAARDIARYTRDTLGNLIPDSSRQLPNNWLYRRGYVDESGASGAIFVGSTNPLFGAKVSDPDASLTWWVDHSNFFQGVGALGGGDVRLVAGHDVANVDAVIPTNARMPSGTPDLGKLVELGGGDLTVLAGRNIDGGVYHIQRGHGTLRADGAITTNATRSINLGILSSLSNPVRLPEETWMPTTLFLGDATVDVSAWGGVLLGPVANTHLLPQGNGNRYWYKTYFSTYGTEAGVSATSLTGDVELRNAVTLPDTSATQPFLQAWLARQNLLSGNSGAAFFQPWLRLAETSVAPFATFATVLPPELRATAFSGDIVLGGDFNLFPSATGTVELLAADSIQALSVAGQSTRIINGQTVAAWQSTRVNLSDAAPGNLPGLVNPFSYFGVVGGSAATSDNSGTRTGFLQSLNRYFNETGATNTVLQTKQALHAPGLLHRDDTAPLYLYALGGDISGLELFSAKSVRIAAARDISDIAFYLQNNRAGQTSSILAGRDIVAHTANSTLRVQARATGNALSAGEQPLAGDIQIAGPGLLEVLAGRNIDLGIGAAASDGTASGITSIGNTRNPYLAQAGADVFVTAGVGAVLDPGQAAPDFSGFIAKFLDPATAGGNSREFLPYLALKMTGLEDAQVEQAYAALTEQERASLTEAGYHGLRGYYRRIAEEAGMDATATWTAFLALSDEGRRQLALTAFYRVLRETGRDYNDPDSPGFRSYDLGKAAIAALFPGENWAGNIALTSRQIKTSAGGSIAILAPGGALTVGLPDGDQRPDQGILTEAGGTINIFARDSVNVGTSRIFTLRGGDITIWSSKGDIAAGSAARTVQSAPPTRVLIDPQSAFVETDLSGLATGGGIGVLQTVPGVAAGNVDLIAPEGTIDAGDAGIRSAGNINLAAANVLNAANIQTGGASVGLPAAAPALNLGALASATSTVAASGGTALESGRNNGAADAVRSGESRPSIYTLEVLGYGGEDEDDAERAKPAPQTEQRAGLAERAEENGQETPRYAVK